MSRQWADAPAYSLQCYSPSRLAFPMMFTLVLTIPVDNPSKWMLCGRWWKGPRRLYKVHVLRRNLVAFLCCWHSHGLPLN